MDALHVFRTDLGGLLLREAIVGVPRGEAPCGADIKRAALLRRLAANSDTLDAAVFRCWAPVLRDRDGHGPFGTHAIALLPSVGVHVCPSDADSLVAWMGAQLMEPSVSQREAAPVRSAPRDATHRRFRLRLSAGLSIVLPLLALCHLLTGGGWSMIGCWPPPGPAGSPPW